MRAAIRAPRRARGQQWIVLLRRAVADHDGVHAAAQLLDHCSRGFAGNPAAVAGASGNFSVERHGPFGDHPRPAGCHQFQIRRVESSRLGFHQADFDRNSRGSSAAIPRPLTASNGSRCAAHHAGNSGGNQRIGARRRFAMVATRFQRDVGRRPFGSRSRHSQGFDLRVRAAELGANLRRRLRRR